MNTTTGSDDQLTAEDVAAIADVSVATIHRYRSRGDMPYGRNIGRTPVWTRAEIDEWLASRPSAGWTRTNS